VEAYAGHQQYLDEIRHGSVEVDQWQLEKLALVGLKHDRYFYAPGVTGRQIGSLAEHHYTDLNAAVAAVTEGLQPDARIALMPNGPYAFARVGTRQV
jgi:hypothetical protein